MPLRDTASSLVADQGPAAVDPACLAVGPDDPERHVQPVLSLARQPSLPRRPHVIPVFRMDRLDPGLRVALEIAKRTPQICSYLGLMIKHFPGRERLDPEHLRHRLGHQPEALLALVHRLLGAPPTRAEFGEQQAEGDEDGEGQHMLRRHMRTNPPGGTNHRSSCTQISEASKPGPRPPYQALRITAASGSW